MVGNGAFVRANVAFTEMGLGDMLVACSDGVHKHLEPRRLEPRPQQQTRAVAA